MDRYPEAAGGDRTGGFFLRLDADSPLWMSSVELTNAFMDPYSGLDEARRVLMRMRCSPAAPQGAAGDSTRPERRRHLHPARHVAHLGDKAAALVVKERIEPGELGLRTLADANDLSALAIPRLRPDRSVVQNDFGGAEETNGRRGHDVWWKHSQRAIHELRIAHDSILSALLDDVTLARGNLAAGRHRLQDAHR